MPVGGYRVADAAHFSKAYRECAGKVKTASFRAPVESYAANMDRLVAMPMLVADLVAWSAMYAKASENAPIVTGDPQRDVSASGIEGLESRYNANMAKQLAPMMGMQPQELADLFWRRGMNFIEHLLQHVEAQDGGIIDGLQAIFCAMVLDSYAAFEGLAVDLWMAAHDDRPAVFRTEGTEAGKAKTAQLRTDAASALQPGEYLKTEGRVTFGSRRSILEAFGDSFGYGSSVYGVLYSSVDLWDVEKVRHLIAHRSGRVDQKFKDGLVGLPRLSSATLDEPLSLDGPLVCALADTCVKTAVNLIEAVDAWGQNNGPTTPNRT